MYVHPDGGSTNPSPDTKLVVWEGYHAATYYEWVPMAAYPGWGGLKHATSDNWIHVITGEQNPDNNIRVVLYPAFN